MRAGRLRNNRVTFQALTRVSDGGGGWTETWGSDLTVDGDYMPERGLEKLAAGRLQASNAGVLRVRSSTQTRAITAEWSVLIGGERFQIRDISNPDQRNVALEMTVEKGVAI